jgi:cysteinyl-tRNA synthetase
MMTIFDSVKRQKVPFSPIQEGEARVYVCGPTVYDDAHLGHARSAISFDLLRRVLEGKGYRVQFARNFTDIDDKIIKKMEESGETLEEITERYMESYTSDMEALNILTPTLQPKATENIEAMSKMVESLLKKDFAYRTSSGDIYFDSSKDSQYLSISGREQSKEERESRLENIEEEKRNSSDFVLWKGEKSGDSVKFNTSIGSGRPGWHIECSAMIDEHLAYRGGEFSIDIHGGGADLLFPHHENEASQSRCSTGHELAKYWMHNGFVKIDGEKMSKSLGNSFFLKDTLKLYSGEVIRFYLISTHYRQDFDFSDTELLNSKKRLDKLYRLKKRVYGGKVGEPEKGLKENLLSSLGDDLNISLALSFIDKFVAEANEKLDSGKVVKGEKREILGNIELIDSLIGVGGSDAFQYFQFGVSEDDREKIEMLISERKEAKAEKDFSRADKIREELSEIGIQIMDTASGTLWEKV